MRGLPSHEDYCGLFDAAIKHGAAVAVIRPLAGGALTDAILDRGSAGRHDLSRGYYRDNPGALSPEIEKAKRFKFLSRGGEQTLAAAAYRYIVTHPAVCTIIGGFSSAAQLEEAARASDAGALSQEDMAQIAKIQDQGF